MVVGVTAAAELGALRHIDDAKRAAAMALVREGRLSWSDTILHVLPDSKLPSADRITVAQLIEMTSGLGDIFGPEFAATPSLYFGPDRFHPSATGYAGMASVLGHDGGLHLALKRGCAERATCACDGDQQHEENGKQRVAHTSGRRAARRIVLTPNGDKEVA